MAHAVFVQGVPMLVCEWFARCTNTTRKVVPHPILDLVPCCARCQNRAEIVDADMKDVEITVQN